MYNASDSTVTGLNAGAKYNCTVDPNKPAYTFYVLNTPAEGADSVNLIMDSNINISGEAVKEGVSDKGNVAWYVDSMDNSFGPITAIDHLQTATAGWTNANPQTINAFIDDEGNAHSMTEYVVNARMPYLSEVEGTGCVQYETGTCPGWMVNYMVDTGYQTNTVSGVSGYWTLSSFASSFGPAWNVHYNGYAGTDDVDIVGDYGIRPVINLSI